MAVKTVVIFPSGPNECMVTPAHVHVQAGDEVKWVNLTGADIKIFMGGADGVFLKVHGAGGAAVAANHVSGAIGPDAPNNIHHLDVKAAAPQVIVGRHPYSVFCDLTNSVALGGSDSEVDVP